MRRRSDLALKKNKYLGGTELSSYLPTCVYVFVISGGWYCILCVHIGSSGGGGVLVVKMSVGG